MAAPLKRHLLILFCVAVAGGSLGVVAWEYWRQPTSYEDCVFRRVTSTTSNDAARIIAVACRNQFPEKPAWINFYEMDYQQQKQKYSPDNPYKDSDKKPISKTAQCWKDFDAKMEEYQRKKREWAKQAPYVLDYSIPPSPQCSDPRPE